MTRVKESISYTVEEAAEACSLGARRIRDACERGDLPSYWAGVKRLILRQDLIDWIASLPTERAS